MKIYPYLQRAIRGRIVAVAAAVCLLTSGALTPPARAQKLSSEDRSRGHLMLDAIKDDIKDNYYDANYRGINLDERFKAGHELIKKATSLGQVFGIIVQTVSIFNDSHTFFLPPSQTSHSEYGWQMKAVGDKCYVVAVKPGTQAEKVGLKVGDRVFTFDGVVPNRDDMWKIRYLYYALRPAPGVRLQVASPGETGPRILDVPAKTKQDKRTLNFSGPNAGNDFWQLIRELQREARLYRDRHETFGDDLMIWKMPSFVVSDAAIDSMMSKAKGRKTLIIDLRGNGGGYVDALERLVGHLFDRDIKIAELKGRKEMKPTLAKTRGNDIFKGKLVVLIDSDSGSASELFARVIQLEKRGTVIGDRSAGAVMQSRQHGHDIGMDIKVFFGASVTMADVIMADGKSLERLGVTPDEVVLPTGEDLAALRDPVMARAAELVGVELDAKKAGSLFPIEWSKD